MDKKTNQIIRWVLTGILVFILMGSGIFKVSGTPDTIEMAESLGGNNNLIILGTLEILIAILFLIPKTSIIAILSMTAYFGGAMAVHLVNGESILVPTTIQVLIWITAVFRFPELTLRFVNEQKISQKKEYK